MTMRTQQKNLKTLSWSVVSNAFFIVCSKSLWSANRLKDFSKVIEAVNSLIRSRVVWQCVAVLNFVQIKESSDIVLLLKGLVWGPFLKFCVSLIDAQIPGELPTLIKRLQNSIIRFAKIPTLSFTQLTFLPGTFKSVTFVKMLN